MYAPPTFTTPHQTTPQGSSAENNNLFINPVAAVDPQFVSDTNNQLYYLGQEQAITWSTNYTKYNIFLWQEALDGSKAAPSPVVLVDPKEVVNNQFMWKVNITPFDLATSNVFFLWMTEEPNNGGGFTSHFFNVTDSPIPSDVSPYATTLQSSTGTLSTSRGHSEGGLVAVAVGLTIGLSVLTAIVTFVWLRFKSRRLLDSPLPEEQQRTDELQRKFSSETTLS